MKTFALVMLGSAACLKFDTGETAAQPFIVYDFR